MRFFDWIKGKRKDEDEALVAEPQDFGTDGGYRPYADDPHGQRVEQIPLTEDIARLAAQADEPSSGYFRNPVYNESPPENYSAPTASTQGRGIGGFFRRLIGRDEQQPTPRAIPVRDDMPATDYSTVGNYAFQSRTPQPSYNYGSQAQRQYAQSQDQDPNDPPGNMLTRGLGKVFRGTFKAVDTVMSIPVRGFQILEQETGIRAGVGYRAREDQWGGRSRNNSNFAFGAAQGNPPNFFNSNNMNMANYTSGGYGSSAYDYSRSGRGGGAPAVYEDLAEEQKPSDYSFFRAPEVNDGRSSALQLFFNETTPKLIGKDGVFSSSDNTFVEAYQATLGEYRTISEKIENHLKRGGTLQEASNIYRKDIATSISRQNLFIALFEESMRHANSNPDLYSSTETASAAIEYIKEHGLKNLQGLPEIQDKKVLDQLKSTFAASFNSRTPNAMIEKIHTAWKTHGKDSATLSYHLDNFVDPARSAAYDELDSAGKAAHENFAKLKFTDPYALVAQKHILCNASVFRGEKGILSDGNDAGDKAKGDGNANRFGVYFTDGGPVLRRFSADDQHADLPIPANKLEATLALITKQSIADKKADINFAESAKEVNDLVKDFGTPQATAFVANTEEAARDELKSIKDRLAKAAEKHSDANNKHEEAKKAQKELVDFRGERDAVLKSNVKAKSDCEANKDTNTLIYRGYAGRIDSLQKEIAALDTQIAEAKKAVETANKELSESKAEFDKALAAAKASGLTEDDIRKLASGVDVPAKPTADAARIAPHTPEQKIENFANAVTQAMKQIGVIPANDLTKELAFKDAMKLQTEKYVENKDNNILIMAVGMLKTSFSVNQIPPEQQAAVLKIIDAAAVTWLDTPPGTLASNTLPQQSVDPSSGLQRPANPQMLG